MTRPAVVAGYGRASTNTQQLTPEIQEKIVRDWFENHKDNKQRFPHGAVFSGFYCEQITSKVDMLYRPIGQFLLQDLERGDFILVAKFSRAFRSAADAEATLDLCRQAGINMVFIDMDVDTSTPNGAMFAGIMGAFSRYERDMITERTRDAMQALKRKGKTVNGKAPIGWYVKAGLIIADQTQRAQALTALHALRHWNGTHGSVRKALIDYHKTHHGTRKPYSHRHIMRMACMAAIGFPRIPYREADAIAQEAMETVYFAKRPTSYHQKIQEKIRQANPLAYPVPDAATDGAQQTSSIENTHGS